LRLGELLLQVHEPEHTVDLDNAVLAKAPANGEAYWQKARALLSLDKFVEGERSLSKAAEYKPNDEDIRKQLTLVREALRLDTSLRGLSRTERADRAVEAFHIAWQRLNTCAAQRGMDFSNPVGATPGGSAPSHNPSPSPTDAVPAPDALQLLYNSGLQKQSGVTQKALREDSDALESTMQYVFDVERATAPLCAQRNLSDDALMMLAQHENEGPK
jgi:tetratricopeptide (TPR) repeat protein